MKIPLILFLLLILSSSYSCAQNAINVSFHQDFKLLVLGDQLGNEAGTLNFVARVKYEAKEYKLGNFIHGLEYEKALLASQYTRFGVFTGYTFIDIFGAHNFNLIPSFGIGFINRQQKNRFSWSSSLVLEYSISDTVSISFLNQLTQRTDLKMLYNDLKHRYSFFIGIDVQLFDLKKN